jgi:putative ABC transport system permease protein
MASSSTTSAEELRFPPLRQVDMYPNLLIPLLATLAVALIGIVVFAVRQPVSRRLALRQIARRKTEAALAITGSVLGTAVIVGALVVGDTLNFSVRQEAYRTLGPIDERVIAPNVTVGRQVSRSLSGLAGDNDVDGVMTTSVEQGAALRGSGASSQAEPRVLAWEMNFAAARHFGANGDDSGIAGATPRPGHVVVNQALAESIDVHAGQTMTLYLYGRRMTARVDRVLPQKGLAGTGLGATVNRNAFLAPGTLLAAAQQAGTSPRSVTFVSNRGGVERGSILTDVVSHRIEAAMGPIASGTLVQTPKHDVLKAAQVAGDSLGSLFLMIGSFSIIAGALLLVNIFVMLGEERKSQLGMLRAVGMKRSYLVSSFTFEGATYALLAAVPALGLGIAVGYGVARLAARIFEGWSATGSGIDIAFAVTPTSIVNGTAMGLVIALVTIVLSSVRISRFNVISAIRDLPSTGNRRSRRRTLAVSTSLAVMCAVASVPAVARSQAELTFLLPSLVAVFATPALLRVLSTRTALSITSAAVLVWSLLASVVRPHVYDTPSMAIYVILGCLTAFSGVVLVSENQSVLLRPFRWLMERPTEGGLASRLAVAYPLAKRFRTGATLVMYALIMLVLVLLTQINGILQAGVDKYVADGTAGYALRLDFNPDAGGRDLLSQLKDDTLVRNARVAPLVSAAGTATDPGYRSTSPIQIVAVGVPKSAISTMTFEHRLPGLETDAAVWSALEKDSRYVVMDPQFGSTGGPGGSYFHPGDHLTMINPSTGRTEQKTIAGILTNAMMFYPSGANAAVFPLITSDTAVRELYGSAAQVASGLVSTPPGVSPDAFATRLQARYLSSSLVVTPLATNMRRLFTANTAFFRLMQGFLALGLLVGISGLGIVMVRAVRERRRDIGVLRALGFRAQTVERSFLIESAFVALQGITLGAVLGVLTTWLMYLKSATFAGFHGGFPIEWTSIGVLVVASFLASVVATVGPARRAAQIKPAIAVRVAT